MKPQPVRRDDDPKDISLLILAMRAAEQKAPKRIIRANQHEKTRK